ncbi:hypothetical protein A1359_07630 [Methylomonas lenta]|uniref:Uncharacterized protein n=1 Tax=Methylomonas lenta TaxID=980561 RepID=A0A177NH36_9GAMM|nr:hypothetical protein [Methylomonas lenta]OAI16509.1 hypothetical protein A1359_07630 [Methylomonas lenta]
MKTSKKRCKLVLSDIERVAEELLILSAQLTLLDELKELVTRVLRLCKVLRSRMSMLKKSNFVEKMRVDDVLIELDAMVDLDMISQLEERFSMAFADSSESQASEMLQQLLEKLERRYVIMLESIQQLAGMLQEAN